MPIGSRQRISDAFPGSGSGFSGAARADDFRSGPPIGAPDRIRDTFVGPDLRKAARGVARLRGARDQAAGPGRKGPSDVQLGFPSRITPVESASFQGVGVCRSDHASGFPTRSLGRGPGFQGRPGRMIFVQVRRSGPRIASEIPSWAPICGRQPAGWPVFGAPAIRLPVLDGKGRPTCNLVFPRESRQSNLLVFKGSGFADRITPADFRRVPWVGVRVFRGGQGG